MRINQFLARSGVASRRKVEDFIKAGKVKVDGKVVTDLATQINPEKNVVEYEGKVIKLPELKYFLLNKPAGYTVTQEDRHAEKTVFELMPPIPGLFAVGRLDKETTGLLLVSNDGQFGQNLIHPSNKVEKEYLVETHQEINPKNLDNLLKGVGLEDGLAKAIRISINGPKSVNVVVQEGRNRLIRRMFDKIGHQDIYLKRLRVGGINLDVEEGKYRELTKEEVESVN